jgi:prepilin-type N-terminal cleavage/methylation domain-containing protein
MKRLAGFTLVELLVGLGVIGVISALTIPKILMNIQDQQSRTELKEALGAVESLVAQGFADEDIVAGNPNSMITYVMDHFRNAARICRTNSNTEGCKPPGSPTLHWSDAAVPGILLRNNSLIAFATWSDCNEAGVGVTCSYIMVYNSQVGSGSNWTGTSAGGRSTRVAQLPLILTQGNPRGGPGTILKKNYIYDADSTWLYE